MILNCVAKVRADLRTVSLTGQSHPVSMCACPIADTLKSDSEADLLNSSFKHSLAELVFFLLSEKTLIQLFKDLTTLDLLTESSSRRLIRPSKIRASR